MSNPNRAILLTAPGPAAIAVVRIVGPLVDTFLAAHFSRPSREGRCVHGELHDGDRVLDDPIVVLLLPGRGADINLHGGPWVVQSLLDLAASFGFDVAETDENALDGTSQLEREMLASLPLATTELALRTLLAQPDAWRGATRRDVPAIVQDRALWWLLHPPRVAIVGSPNVGKSTLANQLFARERSITADLPGTTRDWVGELANLDGLVVMLVDTPGVRETSDEVERAAIECASEQVRAADLVVVVLDPTQPEDGQRGFIEVHPSALIVANKVDRPSVWSAQDRATVSTVAMMGSGVDDLRRAIRERFGCEAIELSGPRWWTVRQREALTRGELPFTA